MSNILVTGGAGFVGSHLCKTLLSQGEKVICLDKRKTKKIEEMKKYDNFEFINQDIISHLEIKNISKIYHLACPASPAVYLDNPIDTILANTVGMFNMSLLAAKNKAQIIFTSSSEVYGDPKEKPQPETYYGNVNPLGNHSCYKEGKRFAETILFNYSKSMNFEYKIARVFNTYGPGMEFDGRVIPTFIEKALKNEPLKVHSNGKQTRSFCFIDDLIDGIIKLGNSKYIQNEALNLGNPEEIKIIKLAEKIIELTNSKSTIEFEKGYTENPRTRVPDITKAKNLLNYNSEIKLEEGLNMTIEYFERVIA